MEFKVTLSLHDREFIKRYTADTLANLFEQIQDEFPKAKIITVIGGG